MQLKTKRARIMIKTPRKGVIGLYFFLMVLISSNAYSQKDPFFLFLCKENQDQKIESVDIYNDTTFVTSLRPIAENRFDSFYYYVNPSDTNIYVQINTSKCIYKIKNNNDVTLQLDDNYMQICLNKISPGRPHKVAEITISDPRGSTQRGFGMDYVKKKNKKVSFLINSAYHRKK